MHGISGGVATIVPNMELSTLDLFVGERVRKRIREEGKWRLMGIFLFGSGKKEGERKWGMSRIFHPGRHYFILSNVEGKVEGNWNETKSM